MSNEEEKNIELIEAYHKGKLSDDEKSDFETRRELDSDFSQQVSDYLLILDEIERVGRVEFEQKIQGWEEEIAAQEPTSSYRWKKILAAAAILLIIAIPTAYFFLGDLLVSKDHHTLYTAYFTPYEDVLTVRGDNDQLSEAINAYNTQQYQKTIDLLNSVLETDPQNETARTYLGITYMVTEDYAMAEENLAKVNLSADGLYKEVSDWYLLLTYLKLDNTEATEAKLSEIVDSKDHIFKEEATQLKAEFND
ncbi:hypothetical protein E1176_16485 [Fulvivirga sp. RKSG066]|uniref:hypothetical protein n=1 Tax=Fulvivirga aurantia TaxID=2529383 RepID=UPI0012BBEF97|nr:hypothetical protein [Fulvivirga aurantia]MTI22631.1 hypothetical protein [Fulvivirga aurantia]